MSDLNFNNNNSLQSSVGTNKDIDEPDFASTTGAPNSPISECSIDSTNNSLQIETMSLVTKTNTIDTHYTNEAHNHKSNNVIDNQLQNTNATNYTHLENEILIPDFHNFEANKENITKKTSSKTYDQESKEVRGRPSACVFVASLSSNISDDVLCQSVTNHFKQWGKLTLVKVLRDPANRPYAFVQYARDEDADKAISEGQHSILNGRTVRCEKARVNRTLYLQVASPGFVEKVMKKLLSRFGEIERLVAVNDQFDCINSSKTPNKTWFCKYVYRQDAISAFANLKSKVNWNVEWAQNLEDEYKNIPEVTIDKNSIFVGHLDPRISKEELLERFEKHGKIKEAILVNRPLSNFAFIKFETKEAAASAVECENHSMFKYKTIHVQYRELYNNYRRKYSNEDENESGLKLNLAPPPVNFKRRNIFNSNKNLNKYNHTNNNYYRRKNNSYFENFNHSNEFNDTLINSNQDKISESKAPETFSQAMRLKFADSNSGKFNYNNSNTSNKFTKNMQHVNSQTRDLLTSNENTGTDKTNSECNDSMEANRTETDIDNKTTQYTYFAENKNDDLSDKNFKAKQPFKDEEYANKNSNTTSVNEYDIDFDSTTNNSYSSAGPRTGYTYSSIDNAEVENPTINVGPMMGPSQYQYPYYYYYHPSKKIPYMNPQMSQMMSMGHNSNNINNSHPPTSANPTYYYTYAGYPPATPNTQIPAMYPPVYLYYNSVSLMDHANESMEQQQFYRNHKENPNVTNNIADTPN